MCIMKGHDAWIFPAFAMRHHEFRRDDIGGYPELVQEMVARANQVVTIHLAKFNAPEQILLDDDLEDTLQLQYACYVDGVSLGKFLKNHFAPADYVAGYSMGLYAALCHSGVYSFEDGLMLMHQICEMAYRSVEPGEYGMGAVMGLNIEEVQQITRTVCDEVEISDVLGVRSAIVSGRLRDVEAVLEEFERAGALNAKIIPVSLPFHSTRLRHMEAEVRTLLGRMNLAAPQVRVVSSITQEVLHTAEDVRDEIARNIGHAMNWYQTMHKLSSLGVTQLTECGMSENLTNLAKRNLRGKFSLRNFRDFGRALASA